MMESTFCELEIESSPPNSSLQQTCSKDLVLLSLMYKWARESSAFFSFTVYEQPKGNSISAELHLNKEKCERQSE